VTQKIIQGVKAIAAGRQEKLQLGNLDIWRDWGWAPDYVEAMHGMVQAPQPQDYVIASGKTHSLREFVDAAFALANLAAEENLAVTRDLMRPRDLRYSSMDSGKIAKGLGWKPEKSLEEIVTKMYNEELT
jgi:GDPmannose 4,6-dehydratase